MTDLKSDLNDDEENFDHDDDYAEEGDGYTGIEEEGGMTFLDHLEEFRWTIARSLVAFLVGIIVVVIFIQDISQFLQRPLLYAYGSSEAVAQNLITYRPMGVFSVFIQIGLLGGLTLSMPFVLYFLGCFIAPGLTEKERAILRPSCFAAFLLFLTGVAFAFFLILPLTLSFAVRFNDFFDFNLLWAASEYYNMVVWFSLAVGVFFQFPLIIVVLVYLGVLAVDQLKKMRRAVFVGLMIFAAFLTPGGDFISLPLTTGFMYGLYEMAIWVSVRIEKKKHLAEMDDLNDE